MRKIDFNFRYGQHHAVINGTKKQFRLVEKNLVKYLKTNFPIQNVVDWQPIPNSDNEFLATLDLGAKFTYQPEYKIGETLIVGETQGKVRIRITGIEIQRLCNANAEQVLNEGFSRTLKDGCKQYCYYDREAKIPCVYRSHEQCLISFLYRTMDKETVLNNPYAVVYKFELLPSVVSTDNSQQTTVNRP